MPQIFWATCPQCGFKFTAEKLLWDRNNPLMCPQCLLYFDRKDSPEVKAVWGPSFDALRKLERELKEEIKR